MSVSEKLKHELRSVLVATLYFAAWFMILIVLKTLILAEYQIEFHGVVKALVGALVIGKVVLVLERVPLGGWVTKQSAWVDVATRTLLYMVGVFLILLAEKMFDERHEYSSFGASFAGAFESANASAVGAKTIAVGWGLLVFNALTVVRRRLGTKALLGLFTTPLPRE